MTNFWQNNLIDLLTYALLMLSVVSFWVDKTKKMPIILFISSIFVGLILNKITCIALSSIILLMCFLYLFYRVNIKNYQKVILFFLISIITILLFLHKIPGYINWRVFYDIKLSDNSSLYSLWLNFDKPIITIGLLLFAYNPLSATSNKTSRKNIILFFSGALAIMLFFGFITSYLKFDPKIPNIDFLSLWILKILFLTVIAEELFFRFFIQNNVISIFKNYKNGTIIGLCISSLLFGLFHLPAGLTFMLLAFIAGLLYGGIYIRTRSLNCAIMLHFVINAIHLICFSYPSSL